ncbi:lysylphosphatidylglycerol synthase transmembrane domain-containing protein [Flammeovirgaceae bacterium SG7u.111]|nr:lysylphosphatidylglycerol synthase transmembrane domain-containing protein [Flammeovirgaceae bacterium SG7u.132]WPO33148.1 lysylphosphatidylglycerol synthase transmembrane domain-containing protein [Flammeovirgaceae bacterium SG7u.111]
MDDKSSKILKSISPNKIIIPVMIGVGAAIFMFMTSDELSIEEILQYFGNADLKWIVLAILVLLARDFGYIYRIRHLTDKQLNWWASAFVIVLWEFASAVTPSVVGGTAVVVFIINKEGIPFGKSLAYVMLTAVLDNMFFVISSVVVFMLLPNNIIFPQLGEMVDAGATSLVVVYLLSSGLIAFYTLVMSYGLFIKPRAFKWILIRITGLRWLKKWRKNAIQIGDDVITASEVLREKQWKYWSKAIVSTIFIWSARYLMLNCLIAAFTNINPYDHFVIFGRQIIMWIVMLISPTPGSTGTAEYFFGLFFKEFFEVAAFSLAVALFWRLFTYYAYLGIGVIVLPQWLKRVFGVKKPTKKNEENIPQN